jgi:RNA polymerase sigma-70 factor (ECF subfamily)
MAHPSSVEDPSSLPAGPAGDTTLMWAEFAGRLRAFVARRVPPGIEPDDVVQEVFLRVLRHLPSLRDAERIEGWLFQIARNALLDAMRERQRRDSRTDAIETDIPSPPEGEDERAAEAELAPCLTPMVARLAEPYRSAIELTSVQGLTQTEAASRAGVSVSGMKSRVQRARDRLKEMLLQCCEVDGDRRRGVADYHPRGSAACGTATPAATPASPCCGAGGAGGPCSPRR